MQDNSTSRPSVSKTVHNSQNNTGKQIRELELGTRVAVRDYLYEKWKFVFINKIIGKLYYTIELDDGRRWKRHIDQIRLIGLNNPTVKMCLLWRKIQQLAEVGECFAQDFMSDKHKIPKLINLLIIWLTLTSTVIINFLQKYGQKTVVASLERQTHDSEDDYDDLQQPLPGLPQEMCL
nr:unnamed protein product [Callosobruchus analis]